MASVNFTPCTMPVTVHGYLNGATANRTADLLALEVQINN